MGFLTLLCCRAVNTQHDIRDGFLSSPGNGLATALAALHLGRIRREHKYLVWLAALSANRSGRPIALSTVFKEAWTVGEDSVNDVLRNDLLNSASPAPNHHQTLTLPAHERRLAERL